VEKKSYLLIFDLDGVLINSKLNMYYSWNNTKKIHAIKKSFKSYFSNVGMPFEKILQKLKIRKYQDLIFKTYKKESLNHFNKIKLYKDVSLTLKNLKLKKHKLAIVTSKDLGRTKKIVKKFNLKFDVICSPMKNLRGKPYPDQLNYVIKKLKYDKKNTFYIGDMMVDYKAAKNAKIQFIFAKYGYGKDFKLYNKKIQNFCEVYKFLN
jgi:HAD superfamily hydrolase (TIGR01662 family)